MSIGTSMRELDLSMLGYRVTKWKGLPMMHIGNGCVSIVHHVGWGGGAFTNLYGVRWLMHEPVSGGGWSNNYCLYKDVGDGSHIGENGYQVYGDNVGYLEDSNIIFVKDEDFLGEGYEDVDIEVYYFCPMQTDYLDSFVIVAVIKNGSDSDKTFYVGLKNPNRYLKTP